MSIVTQAMNTVCDTAVSGGVSAGFGYLFARAFTSINPVNGAVFAGVACVVSKITSPIFDAIFQAKNSNDSSQFIGSVLKVVTGIAASSYISGALGYPVTLGAAATMTYGPAAIVAGIALSIMGVVAVIGFYGSLSYGHPG